MSPKLWLLTPVDSEDRARWSYDCMFGFVIRAPSEETARKLASTRAGDEGKDSWLSSTFSRCVVLPVEGPVEIILEDFRAG